MAELAAVGVAVTKLGGVGVAVPTSVAWAVARTTMAAAVRTFPGVGVLVTTTKSPVGKGGGVAGAGPVTINKTGPVPSVAGPYPVSQEKKSSSPASGPSRRKAIEVWPSISACCSRLSCSALNTNWLVASGARPAWPRGGRRDCSTGALWMSWKLLRLQLALICGSSQRTSQAPVPARFETLVVEARERKRGVADGRAAGQAGEVELDCTMEDLALHRAGVQEGVAEMIAARFLAADPADLAGGWRHAD